MNLDQVRIFVSVYRAGNFATVAKELDMAPSSVSRAIANLEHSLKTRLFQRTTRTLTPTQAGEQYFQRVGSLIDEFDTAHQELLEQSLGPTGRLRVSASVSYGQIELAPRLKDFYQLYPNINIELILSDTRLDIIANQVDVAIRHGKLPDSSLVARKLTDVKYGLVASDDYLRNASKIDSPSDIIQHPLITFDYEALKKQWTFKGEQQTQTIDIQPQLIITNAAAMRECVKSGFGIALLADWTVREDIQSGKLVQVLPHWSVSGSDSQSAIWLIHPARTYVPAKTRAFMDFLLNT
ncbi:LysR family transcriptional regulator [Alteromonadaceae bacterium BrNp21-10]|nr:LysR family transcriptional regulator [Alteromonadaceae bacterium BrNp21-10]